MFRRVSTDLVFFLMLFAVLVFRNNRSGSDVKCHRRVPVCNITCLSRRNLFVSGWGRLLSVLICQRLPRLREGTPLCVCHGDQ